MKGNDQVIAYLNTLLAGELSAIDQYFIHSRMYENWGFSKLYERIAHEVLDETNHADALIKRILFLEGTPDLTKTRSVACRKHGGRNAEKRSGAGASGGGRFAQGDGVL
jgi:bacterioferritin